MNIKTKFEVGEVVEHKFNTEHDGIIQVYDVKEITTQSCYALTQVFYHVKPIEMTKEHERKFDEKSPFKWSVRVSMPNNEGQMGWVKLREDDLIAATKEVKAILKIK